MSRFVQPYPVRFGHCDPAGIVFFPQYFVMLNGLVEDWFVQALGIDYHALVSERRVGLPTVSLQCDFMAPSRMGEQVDFGLDVTRLGQRSITLSVDCRLGEQTRLRLRQVLVTTALDAGHAIDIPPDLRDAIAGWLTSPSSPSNPTGTL